MASAACRSTGPMSVAKRQRTSEAKRLIDLRKGHPKARNLPHAQIAEACKRSAGRLELAAEAEFPLQYTNGALGTNRFRTRLASFLQEEYGSPVFPEWLMTTNGVSHGLELVCGALAKAGDTVVMEEPSYFLARQIFLDHGLQVVGATSDTQGLDTDALASRLASGDIEKPKLLYLVPSHGNPSGASLDLSRRKKLVSLAKEHGFVIVCDDVYHLLDWTNSAATAPPRIVQLDPVYQQRVQQSEGSGQKIAQDDEEDLSYVQDQGSSSSSTTSEGNVVSVGSFTKILAPGVRLGWIEASTKMIDRIARRGYLVSGGSVAPFASEVVSELLVDGGQKAVLKNLCSDYSKSSRAMCDALRSYPDCFSFVEPSGGYFVWCKLPDGIAARKLLPVAERHGVVFLPGPMCVASSAPEALESGIRLCFAFEETEAIIEGVGRLASAVREVKQSCTS